MLLMIVVPKTRLRKIQKAGGKTKSHTKKFTSIKLVRPSQMKKLAPQELERLIDIGKKELYLLERFAPLGGENFQKKEAAKKYFKLQIAFAEKTLREKLGRG